MGALGAFLIEMLLASRGLRDQANSANEVGEAFEQAAEGVGVPNRADALFRAGHSFYLAVVRTISHRVAVIYSGAIVEIARKDALYAGPAHPYTRALLDAVPRLDPARKRTKPIAGEVPSLFAPLPGCRFHSRCPHVMPRCQTEEPALRELAPGRLVACHLYETT
jgi:oligopeptide/dipeptide ABC transporter ATP-binding protein